MRQAAAAQATSRLNGSFPGRRPAGSDPMSPLSFDESSRSTLDVTGAGAHRRDAKLLSSLASR